MSKYKNMSINTWWAFKIIEIYDGYQTILVSARFVIQSKGGSRILRKGPEVRNFFRNSNHCKAF